MEYRRFGNSGMKVSALGLGTNTFGTFADEQTAAAIIDRAIEVGVNFIDTADIYGKRGRSEEYIGKALKGKRDKVIILSKFGMVMGDGPNEKGGSRYHVMRAVEASLRRLQTDYLDVYLLHRPDPDTPIEETLRALTDLVQAGKVRYIGCSNFAAWQLCDALWTSRLHNLPSFVAVESQYNVFERHIEYDLVPCCERYGVGVIPWAPLAGGVLTGKYRKGEAPPPGTRLAGPTYGSSHQIKEENWSKLPQLESFARDRGHTMAELALAWLLAHPFIPTVIAGARKPEQVESNARAVEWKLTEAELAELNGICAL